MPKTRPRKPVHLNLSSKVSMAVLTIILTLGILATLTTYFASRKFLAEHQIEDLLGTTVLQSHETTLVFVHSQNIVKSIASQQSTIDLFSDPTSKENLKQVSLESFNIGNAYSSIYLIDLNGKTILSTDKSFEGNNYGFRDYFRKAISGERYTDVLVGVTSKKLGYYFSHPITTSRGEIVGVAVVKLIPDFVNQTLEDHVTEDTEVLVVDKYGVAVYASNPDRLYSSLGPLSESLLEEVKEKKRYAGIHIKTLNYPVVRERLLNYEEPTIINTYSQDDKRGGILSLSQIGDFPFFILTEIETKQATKLATTTALTLAAFVLIAVLLAILIISILISRFLKPLSELQQATKNISQGNFDQKVNINSGDELEDFANTLNTMTDSLKESRSNIEKKVAERTQQLGKLNNTMIGRELKMIELKKEIEELKLKLSIKK